MAPLGVGAKKEELDKCSTAVASIKQLIHAVCNRAGRHHAREVARELTVFEEIDGRQTADAHLVGYVLRDFNIYAVTAHPILIIFGKSLDDGVHDGAFT